jgi:hypothetical protein
MNRFVVAALALICKSASLKPHQLQVQWREKYAYSVGGLISMVAAHCNKSTVMLVIARLPHDGRSTW